MIKMRFMIGLLYLWQGDDDRQAPAWRFFCMDLAVQGRNDLFDNGQTQTAAFFDIRPGSIGPVKTVE